MFEFLGCVFTDRQFAVIGSIIGIVLLAMIGWVWLSIRKYRLDTPHHEHGSDY